MPPPLPQPFAYPAVLHVRRHAPTGYTDYKEYKDWLRDEFEFRCVYCLQRERWSRDGAAVYGVDHVVPQSNSAGRALVCTYSNLLYACNRCNSLRQDCALPLRPDDTPLAEHLAVTPDGTLAATTLEGEELLELLHLNAPAAVAERRRIIHILSEFAKDPESPIHQEAYFRAFGYPDDLPDLAAKRPPGGNPLTANALTCHHSRRAAGLLPEVY
jgi:hypothetical protein